MRCPSCGFDNPDGLKFRGECGTPLMARCPACGCANPPRFKFCGECGASIGPPSRPAPPSTLAAQPQLPSRYTPAYLAEKILTSKTALDGERKQVTVLIVNVPEVTRHLERLGTVGEPYAVRQSLVMLADRERRWTEHDR